ncbi:MAG: DUF3108 domain-containing protein [Acidisphaera sp.]|nr:DUF3108 domain-containing protein [Acidisphaera sp.]
MRTVLVLLAALWPLTGEAQEAGGVGMSFIVYAAGLNTANVQARIAMSPSAYQAWLSFRTAGLFGTFFHSEQTTQVAGGWSGDTPLPAHFESSGILRGEARRTDIDYVDGQPEVRSLVPPEEADREPVPATLQRDTIDTLTGMAMLIRRVAGSGRCDAQARLFDGRRLMEIRATTAGPETLEHSARSPYFGPALRCDFVGQLLAGFKRDENMAEQRRPKRGSAWFAELVPGSQPIPIRLTFETHWFGFATMYLTGISTSVGPPAGEAASR